MSASLTDLPPVPRGGTGGHGRRHHSVHQHQSNSSATPLRGGGHRRSQSLDSPARPSLAMTLGAPKTARAAQDGSGGAVEAANAPKGIEAALGKLSPPSRAQWDRAKARFRKQLPNHPLSRQPGNDGDEARGTGGDGGGADPLESTDFREQFKLHWDPDALWKTLEHIIERHAKVNAMHDPAKGSGSSSGRRRRSSLQPKTDSNSRTGTSASTGGGGTVEPDAVERIFQHCDLDSNGEMDRHEFKKLLREARVFTGVSNQAFSRMVREDFSTIDADHNVRISLEEFRNYVEKMRLASQQRQLLDHVAELQAAYGESSAAPAIRGAKVSTSLPGVKSVSFGDANGKGHKTYHVTRPTPSRRAPPAPRRQKSRRNSAGGLDSLLSDKQKSDVTEQLKSKGMTTSLVTMAKEDRMDLDDAIKSNSEHRVNDLMRQYLKRRSSSREVLLCRGGLPPLVFAAIHGALKVVRVFMTEWSAVIDSSLLGCEKEIIVSACDEGNPNKVRHIVQDLYLESYKRSVLLATMAAENVDAARNTLKAVYFPPKEKKAPKLIKAPKRTMPKPKDEDEPWHRNVLGEDLIAACKAEDLEIVEDCLRARVDPNYRDKSGNTALMAAGSRGNERIIKTLIHCSARVDIVNARKNTAIHFIAEHKHRHIAVELIESNHEARECLVMSNKLGFFPHALSRQRDVYLSDLLQTMHNAQKEDAARKKQLKMAHRAPPSGAASSSSSSSSSKSPRRSSKHGKAAAGKYKTTGRKAKKASVGTVATDAQPANASRSANVTAAAATLPAATATKTKTGAAALASAVRRANAKLGSGANKADTGDGSSTVGTISAAASALVSATASAMITGARQKKGRRGSLSRNAKDGFLGKGADWIARSCMHNDMRALYNHITSGFDVLRSDAFGLCAIHHACAVGNFEMAKVLLEHKADPRARTPQGNTVLHFLENNYYRSADVYDLVHRLAPEAMMECEEARNIHGEVPREVRLSTVEDAKGGRK